MSAKVYKAKPLKGKKKRKFEQLKADMRAEHSKTIHKQRKTKRFPGRRYIGG